MSKQSGENTCITPEETFKLGKRIGKSLSGGEVILLSGGLGAGKTLLTKGILNGLDFDAREVTSPSFTLVNLYKTVKFDVYHIDLWRLEKGSDIAFAVGLSEILENKKTVVIIEWAERLGAYPFSSTVIHIKIGGDGDQPRIITIASRQGNLNKIKIPSE
ncbi:MAG: tRNA (adenosine(37)-N6)-threonylcarbamoyltransferase complex ATPase subunit type 1 TsaE [Pyrinomonadaceae bacterium]|jgi:tRNA threonylcarbamoyladenosine biosynthesis protein TsaE|nr:tRNA (adenosine(37)-N6)-threonylcarbamoyltransferase complex ATPase subunit type 1 TsaE [Acidobacteriota bacterium]